MIAHRGGYNLDLVTENSISNSFYTLMHYNSKIEIDLFFYQNKIYIGHDINKVLKCKLLLNIFIKKLKNYINIIYLDIKTDNQPDLFQFATELFLILNEYNLKYFIHSNDLFFLNILKNYFLYHNYGYLIDNDIPLPSNIKSHYNYIVIPIELIHLFQEQKYPKNIYWYTFKNNYEWLLFKMIHRLPNTHFAFIDIFY